MAFLDAYHLSCEYYSSKIPRYNSPQSIERNHRSIQVCYSPHQADGLASTINFANYSIIHILDWDNLLYEIGANLRGYCVRRNRGFLMEHSIVYKRFIQAISDWKIS